MIRLLGIGLIAVILAGTGFCYGKATREEIRRWEGFLKLVRLIRSRISCFRQPLAVIYADFSDEALDACGFTEELKKGSFSQALAKTKDTLGLRTELIAILSDFGGELGKSHADDQIQHCNRCLHQMEEALAMLETERPEKTRLVRTLSFAVAAMATLLLL